MKTSGRFIAAWALVFCLGITMIISTPAKAKEACISTEEYYSGRVDIDATYCELETQIAVKKYNNIAELNVEERKLIQEKYPYLIFIGVIPDDVGSLVMYDLANAHISYTTIYLNINFDTMDETHYLLLMAYLTLSQTNITESHFNVELPTSHKIIDELVKSTIENIEYNGSSEDFITCYWQVFVPGRKPIETILSDLFSQCLSEISHKE